MNDECVQKPTPVIERRPIVELVISEENDYGIGNGRLLFLLPRFLLTRA